MGPIVRFGSASITSEVELLRARIQGDEVGERQASVVLHIYLTVFLIYLSKRGHFSFEGHQSEQAQSNSRVWQG